MQLGHTQLTTLSAGKGNGRGCVLTVDILATSLDIIQKGGLHCTTFFQRVGHFSEPPAVSLKALSLQPLTLRFQIMYLNPVYVFSAQIDSGATTNFMDQAIAHKLKLVLLLLVNTIDGGPTFQWLCHQPLSKHHAFLQPHLSTFSCWAKGYGKICSGGIAAVLHHSLHLTSLSRGSSLWRRKVEDYAPILITMD